MKYPCIETTLDYEYGDYVIRLWLNEKTVTERIYPDLISFIRESSCGTTQTSEIIAKLANFENINAIQIKQKPKDGISWGVVVYTVEFAGDVHG